MAQEITRIVPIPTVTPTSPAQLTHLPQWVEERLFFIDHKRKLDEFTRTTEGRIIVEIPSRLMLNPSQRLMIERRIGELKRLAAPGPAEEIDEALTMLVTRYETARMTDQQIGARVGFYVMVLAEFPAWTVREAIARWFKGEIGRQYDRSFQPPEHVLRDCCKDLVMVAQGVTGSLQRVLDARPEREGPTEEGRALMAKAAAELAQAIERQADPAKRPRSPEELAELERIKRNPGKPLLERMREERKEQGEWMAS